MLVWNNGGDPTDELTHKRNCAPRVEKQQEIVLWWTSDSNFKPWNHFAIQRKPIPVLGKAKKEKQPDQRNNLANIFNQYPLTSTVLILAANSELLWSETRISKPPLILYKKEHHPKVNIVRENQPCSQIFCFSLPLLPNTRCSTKLDRIIGNKARHGQHQFRHKFIIKSPALPSKVLQPQLRSLVVVSRKASPLKSRISPMKNRFCSPLRSKVSMHSVAFKPPTTLKL